MQKSAFMGVCVLYIRITMQIKEVFSKINGLSFPDCCWPAWSVVINDMLLWPKKTSMTLRNKPSVCKKKSENLFLVVMLVIQ